MIDEAEFTMTIKLNDPMDLIALVQQRDDLLAALKALVEHAETEARFQIAEWVRYPSTSAVDAARALIARIEGGK